MGRLGYESEYLHNSEWTQVFSNPRSCKALLDRITDRRTSLECYQFRGTLEVWQKKNPSKEERS